MMPTTRLGCSIETGLFYWLACGLTHHFTILSTVLSRAYKGLFVHKNPPSNIIEFQRIRRTPVLLPNKNVDHSQNNTV
jgi:hypothetical protein